MVEYDEIEKDDKLPHKLMENTFNIVYNRDWKLYLQSIEWDGLWLKHDTEEEKEIKRLKRIEYQEKLDFENHPFRKWF
jgi:uncharacterized protein (DUF1919 family)